MLIIGSHVSFGTKQLLQSVTEAVSYNADTFMFYTGAPQNTIRKDIDDTLTLQATVIMQENKIDINAIKIDNKMRIMKNDNGYDFQIVYKIYFFYLNYYI